MTKRESIQAIKDRLQAKGADLRPEDLAPYSQDERKGVQQVLKTYQRRIDRAQEEGAAIQELRAYEDQLRAQGYAYIAGVDEVGRGPLAGPVVTCAVILPPDMPAVYFNDSKQLSHKKRQALVADIDKYALACEIGLSPAERIDRINILQATKEAMAASVNQLQPKASYVLVDVITIPGISQPQEAIIKGDARIYSIAAASIYAKEYRDRLMADYAELYPEYGFDQHAGYGTKAHLEALAKYGPCPIHRKSFAPVKDFI